MALKKEKAITQALNVLNESITSYQKAENLPQFPIEYHQVFTDYNELIRSLRDSMIQRFEFCVDLFWKHIKDYLENIEKVTLTVRSPKSIIRALCNARLITEQQAEQAIQMINHRNLSSHIYKEEIAEEISLHIPTYYSLIYQIVETLSKKS